MAQMATACFAAPAALAPRRAAAAHPPCSPLRGPRRSPAAGRTARRRPRVAAVFLPPGGAPVLPDDADDEADTSTADGLSDGDWPRPEEGAAALAKPAGDMSSVDRVLGDSSPEYDTWVSRNRVRSLSAVRGRSEATVGADELNAADGPGAHLSRLRHVLAPDEAFGAIFTWDVVMRNARDLELAAWRQVADEEALEPPDMQDVLRAETMAAEAAVTRCFFWTDDWGEIKRLVFRKGEVYEALQAGWVYELSAGVGEWLDTLKRYGIKSVLCAPRSLARVLETVKQVGLEQYFTTAADLVTVEEEYESLEQMFLMASIKLERPPGKCVVFTDKPEAITAGREVSSRVVALIGAHPAYEIKSADKTIASFEDLVVYHVRSLFAQQGAEMMDPETELEVNVDAR